MTLINIGFGNIIPTSRIVAVIGTDSAPTKRMIQEGKESKTAIDATQGRRTRSVIIMDSGHIVLSALQPETVAARIDEKNIAMEVNK